MNMNENKIFFSPAVTPEQQGQRLDRFLAACFGEMSRSQIQRLVSGGNLSADDGLIVDNAFRVRCGDIYQLEVPAAEEADPEPEDIPLDVAYEDRDLIVVNKPAGMTVHPAPGAPRGTLVNALLFHCRDNLSGIGGVKRPGIVHRIDKDTSGLIVAAKMILPIAVCASSFLYILSNGRILPSFTVFPLLWRGGLKPMSGAARMIGKKWRFSRPAAKLRLPIIRPQRFWAGGIFGSV